MLPESAKNKYTTEKREKKFLSETNTVHTDSFPLDTLLNFFLFADQTFFSPLKHTSCRISILYKRLIFRT